MELSIVPYIPATITVHLGLPNQTAENVTVDFPQYVKNVASSEVYPTWEPEALKANILAIISFALNRVYTEYYISRGYNFDITSTTAYDQKFIRGRTIFENISVLVDEIFDNYIRRTGFIEPLAAKFCNGTTSTCDGLSQWGSQSMAQAGRSAMEILYAYYGRNIQLVTDVPLQEREQSYPGTPQRLGSVGPAVVIIQSSLNRISQNYPAIPKIWPVSGIYGESTRAAVKAFQEIFGLTPDGIVGRATWYELVRLYVAVTRLGELVSEGQIYSQASFQYPGLLRRGDRGESVQLLQYMLTLIAEFDEGLPQLSVDGIFGAATEDAVRTFQRREGLTADGLVGRATWNALYRAFSTIAYTLQNDLVRFPFSQSDGEAVQTMTGTEHSNYGQTTRMGQYPGYPLEQGSGEERGEQV